MGRVLSLLGLGLLSVACAQAELVALQDNELAAVQGAGIGVVLEQVMIDAGQTDANRATITINDITSGNKAINGGGKNVPISVKEFYLGATGSNKCAENCRDLKPVNIGRLTHPFSLSLDKGEDINTLSERWVKRYKSVLVNDIATTVSYWAPNGTLQSIQTTPSNVAVLGLTFPERLAPTTSGGQPCIAGFAAAGGNCTSRATEKVDMGIRFDFQVATGRTDVINVDVTQLAMDGSYLRLWGDKTRKQLVGEAQLNVFAKTIDIMSCDPSKPTCGNSDATTQAALQAARSIYLTNVYANVAFGYGKYQPLLLDVSSDGQFVLELPNPLAGATTSGEREARATDFYGNAPRTNIVVDNLNFGGTRITGAVPNAGTYTADVYTDGTPAGTPGVYTPGVYTAGTTSPTTGGYNLGRSEISGLSFNYLKVTSHDLLLPP